jgi:hypothetical protein
MSRPCSFAETRVFAGETIGGVGTDVGPERKPIQESIASSLV